MNIPVDCAKATTRALHELMLAGDSAEVFIQELTYLAAGTFSTQTRVECSVTYRPTSSGALTVASSSAAVVLMDEAQYDVDDGPCLRALSTGHVTYVHDTSTDLRWPHFFRSVQRLGFRSVLGLPLWIGEQGAAALNLYASEPDFFDHTMQEAAEDFAQQGGSTLEMLLRHENAQQQALNLQAAMTSRTIIDLAVGIVMGQNRCSQAEAFEIVKNASNHQNMKVRIIAQRLIEAVTTETPTTHFTDGAGSEGGLPLRA